MASNQIYCVLMSFFNLKEVNIDGWQSVKLPTCTVLTIEARLDYAST